VSRPTVIIELAGQAALPRDLAAGGVFVADCALGLAEECDLVVRGADQQLRIPARVVYVDGRGGAGVELLGFSAELKAQLAALAPADSWRRTGDAAPPAGRSPLDDDLAIPRLSGGHDDRSVPRLALGSLEVTASEIDRVFAGLAADDRALDRPFAAVVDDADDVEVADADRTARTALALPTDDDSDDGSAGDPELERSLAALADADADARGPALADLGVDDGSAGDPELERSLAALADADAAHALAGRGLDDGSAEGAALERSFAALADADVEGADADRPGGDAPGPWPRDADAATADGDDADREHDDAGGRAPGSGRRFALNVNERLRGLNLAAQLRLAQSGEAHERIVLERLYGKNVWETLLRNPRLTAPEVSRIARYGTLPRVLLEIIVGNNAWLQVPEVRRALLSNPRLGTDQIVKVLRLTPKHELKLAAIQTAYPHAVRNAARLMLRGD
jgi:hypothetical protein